MIARTAPMGWNSWNTFGANISDALVREMADAMVEKGYRDAGYEYLVIDDCWSLRERGAALPESVYTAQQLHEAVLALLRKGGRD